MRADSIHSGGGLVSQHVIRLSKSAAGDGLLVRSGFCTYYETFSPSNLSSVNTRICNADSYPELRPVDSPAVLVGAATNDQAVHEGACEYLSSAFLS